MDTAGKKRTIPFIILIFIAALALRLGPVLAGRDLGIGLDDMFQYDMLARSLVAGNGYRWYAQADLNLVTRYIQFDLTGYDPRGMITAFRAPLYPAFLALIYFVSGVGPQRLLAARLAQAFLGAWLPVLTYWVARRLFPESERIPRSAAVIVTAYPMFIAFPLALATENLFFVLFMAAVLALLSATETRHTRTFIGAGILLGLTALTRSVVLIAAALAILWMWVYLKERRGAIIVFIALICTIAPWMIRNALVFHRPVIELSTGYNLYVGYHPKGDGIFQYGISVDLMPILDDAERERIGLEKALGFIRNDPARVSYLTLHRLAHFFSLERRAWEYFYSNNFFGYIPFVYLLPIALILMLPFVIITPAALLGFATMPYRGAHVLIAALMCGYILPHLLILAEDRFHLTLVPLFAIGAAVFFANGRQRLRQLWTTRHTVLIGVIVLGLTLLFLNWGLEIHADWSRLLTLFGPDGNHANFNY